MCGCMVFGMAGSFVVVMEGIWFRHFGFHLTTRDLISAC